ncbi:hypothetical protein QF117_10690 [Vibrio sp. YMD68]|uniref:hypothetical protein n=1 Tax=Vibrio sp. YMD68 TaxID=3042300 RepID=UPI00249B86B3|nr:hypothetical protein [Vibrio sp. YMD68]WGV98817.1 hypothetical protein QF117_02325 [Vibrio sp. YMD68]WGW01256.1 hypothetical protein QF117_10690 [Vibrio sp. YMD68]
MSNLTASMVLKLTNQASTPLKQAAKDTNSFNVQVSSTNSALTKLNATSSKMTLFQEMKKRSLDTNRAIESQQQTLNRLAKEIKSTDKPTKALTKSFEVARTRMVALKKVQQEQRQSLQQTRSELVRSGIDTKKLTAEQKHLQRQASTVNSTLKAQQYQLKLQQGRATIAAKQQKAYNQALGETKAGLMTVQKWGVRAAGAASLASVGVFKLTNNLASSLDSAQKHADKLGLSVTAVQELDYAAKRSGLSIEQTRMAMQRSTRRISEAANGTGEAVAALNELGLSATYLNSLKPDEQLHSIADAMAGVEKPSDRVRLAMKLFDSEGVAMVNMLKDGSKGLQQLREDAKRTGNVFDEKSARQAEEYNDRLLDVTTTFAGMKNQLLIQLLPTFTSVFTRVTSWVSENQATITLWGTRVAGSIAWVADNADTLGYVIAGLGAVKVVGGLLTLTTGVIRFGQSLMTVITLGKGLAVGLTAIAAANPIGLMVAGGAALVTLGVTLYKKWEPARKLFDAIGSTVMSLLKGIAKVSGLSWLWNKVTGSSSETNTQKSSEVEPYNYHIGGQAPQTNTYTSYKPVTSNRKHVDISIDVAAPVIPITIENGDEHEVRRVVRQELERYKREMNDQLTSRLGDISL